MSRLSSALTLAALPLALAFASGCGSAASAHAVSATAYHSSICRGTDRWSSDAHRPYFTMKGLALQFKYGSPTQSGTRTKEISATAGLAAATERLRKAEEAAGIPRINHGSDYAREVVAATQELERSFQHLHDEAEGLSSAGGPASQSALLEPQMSAALEKFAQRVKAARSRYDVSFAGCGTSSS